MRTALVVDDEGFVRLRTTNMLMDGGFQVVEANSAEEALRRIRDGLRPDVLVTDHLMPWISGVDLARELKQRAPELPVLIVSGYAELEGIAPELARLSMPFRNADLAASLAVMG